jgi:hypothetical protein
MGLRWKIIRTAGSKSGPRKSTSRRDRCAYRAPSGRRSAGTRRGLLLPERAPRTVNDKKRHPPAGGLSLGAAMSVLYGRRRPPPGPPTVGFCGARCPSCSRPKRPQPLERQLLLHRSRHGRSVSDPSPSSCAKPPPCYVLRSGIPEEARDLPDRFGSHEATECPVPRRVPLEAPGAGLRPVAPLGSAPSPHRGAPRPALIPEVMPRPLTPGKGTQVGPRPRRPGLPRPRGRAPGPVNPVAALPPHDPGTADPRCGRPGRG